MNKKEYDGQRYIENREKILKHCKQYYLKNREKCIERTSEYQRDNPESRRAAYRRWYENNLEEERKRSRQYRRNHHEEIREYEKYKYKTDLRYNLNCKIRHLMNYSLRGNKEGRKWEILVGYTVNDLMKYLKKTISKGYTWQDYLSGKLHLDHIIPISAFNFTKPEHMDFKRCWALKNLRLLPAKENLIKNAKLVKPFQPALAF